LCIVNNPGKNNNGIKLSKGLNFNFIFVKV